MMGFWFLEVGGLLHVIMTLQYFLSGHMFPLSLLPEWVQSGIIWMPFAYETYYPTMVLLQKYGLVEVLGVIGVQSLWILVLWGLIWLAWSRGLRRYAAFGG
jgi:ABC-2 type transport system permease protein